MQLPVDAHTSKSTTTFTMLDLPGSRTVLAGRTRVVARPLRRTVAVGLGSGDVHVAALGVGAVVELAARQVVDPGVGVGLDRVGHRTRTVVGEDPRGRVVG